VTENLTAHGKEEEEMAAVSARIGASSEVDQGERTTSRAAQRLQLMGLEKRYGDVIAVQSMDLDVAAGEFVTLLGPSGSGKSTTLAMVAGFEEPTRGSVCLGDADITRLPTHRRNLGMVFQGYALFPHMSVFDNVAFGLRLKRVRGDELRRRVAEALRSVALEGMEHRRPSELSGGQQQRVALARAIVGDPPLLLMDEPLSALDKALRKHMQVELRHIHRNVGTTLLYVTHDQEEALSLSDRIVVMHEGRVMQVGTPQEIYECPSTRFVAEFIGEANFVEIRDIAAAANGHVRGVADDGAQLCGRVAGKLSSDGSASLVLRPEDAVLGAADAATHNTLTVAVRELVYVGDRVRCVGARPSGDECVIWLDHAAVPEVRVGEEVAFSWPHSRSVVVGRESTVEGVA
jgi:putative spermidine/putrescine transport system ATP-binding protein